MTGLRRVAITGEIDLNSALAQLANARYAPESLNSGARRGLNRHGGETLAVLTSLAEVRAAVNEIAATAQRLISIYTPDLEPDLYDQSAFLGDRRGPPAALPVVPASGRPFAARRQPTFTRLVHTARCQLGPLRQSFQPGNFLAQALVFLFQHGDTGQQLDHQLLQVSQ